MIHRSVIWITDSPAPGIFLNRILCEIFVLQSKRHLKYKWANGSVKMEYKEENKCSNFKRHNSTCNMHFASVYYLMHISPMIKEL